MAIRAAAPLRSRRRIGATFACAVPLPDRTRARPLVTDSRNAFQAAMEDRFIAAVEGLSGRQVVQFISSHHVGPDLQVELFLLARPRLQHDA